MLFYWLQPSVCHTNTPSNFAVRKESMRQYLSDVNKHFSSAVLTPSHPTLCLYIELEGNFMVHSIQLHFLFTSFLCPGSITWYASYAFLFGFISCMSNLDKERKGIGREWRARHRRGILISHSVESQPGDIRALRFLRTNYREAKHSWSVVGYSFSLLRLFL